MSQSRSDTAFRNKRHPSKDLSAPHLRALRKELLLVRADVERVELAHAELPPGGAAVIALVGALGFFHLAQQRVHLFQRQLPVGAHGAVAGHGGEQFVAGAAWGCMLMSAISAALAVGETGAEGKVLGLVFSALALATFARMPSRLPSSPRYAAHSQTAIDTSTGASSGYNPIWP